VNYEVFLAIYCKGWETAADTQGPVVEAHGTVPIVVDPGAAASFTITANLNDIRTGNSNITAAEYEIQGLVSPTAMSDASGFNTPAEAAVAVQASSLAPGTHQLCIRGQDQASNWGEWSCQGLEVLSGSGDTIPPKKATVTSAVLTETSPNNFDDVVINWDAAEDEWDAGGTIEYQIWRATGTITSSCTQIGTVPAINVSSYQYTCVSCGQIDTNTYFFEIRTVDNVSNSATADDVAAKYYQATTLGKNLVTIPLIQADYGLDVVFQTIWNDVDIIRTYRAADVGDSWKAYYSWKPGDLTSTAFAEAFWVHTSGPGAYVVAGLVHSAPSVGLESGWNFVAYASFTPVDMQTTMAGVSSLIRVETLLDLGDPYSLGGIYGSDMLVPGQGYWVQVTSVETWSQ
jgi:hypothetical protein